MNREEAKKRSETLKRLREQHSDGVKAAQAMLKIQNETRKALSQAMKEQARTVPELATETGIPAHEVLWHVTAMKKYDLVKEEGLSGYYYSYRLVDAHLAEGKK
jgi:predicted transcriptional regulator